MEDNFYYKTEPFFEVDPLENKDFLADNLLERRTLNSVAIVKLKKLNEHLLQKFIGKIPRDTQAKKRKANHLKYLICSLNHVISNEDGHIKKILGLNLTYWSLYCLIKTT